MRPDANQIALKAVRSILASAAPFDLVVNGRPVSCAVARSITPWPQIEGLDPTTDGPWPNEVVVTCSWEGGRTVLSVDCDYWKTKGRYRHLLGLRVRRKTRPGEVVWITVPRHFRDSRDGYTAPLHGSVSTVKRKKEGTADRARLVNDALRNLLRGSGLPIASASRAEICRVAVPGGEVEPSAEVAFRRLVHLALLKVDFFDRRQRPADEGLPLIDVKAHLGDDATVLDELDDELAEVSEEDEGDDENEATTGSVAPTPERGYWAGGIEWGGESQRERFISGRFWQLGWQRTDPTAAAQVAWRRFDRIKLGDWLAIKGYGGRNQLKTYFVGEVTSIEPQSGRVDLRRLDVPPYHDVAPGGAGAGSFRDALLPVTREDVIQVLFGSRAPIAAAAAARPDLPLNLVLYGPPGTGKTYRLQNQYVPLFTRPAPEVRELDRVSEVARDLTWFECIALALDQLGGRAKVADLVAHPVLKAKHALAPHANPREIAWGTLGYHTVESSVTVKMQRRLGDLIFDKEPDGTWKLVEPLPDEVVAARGRLVGRPTAAELKDYTFITFHQAYAYEDFVEGIRPQLSDALETDEGGVKYELVDGVFKTAVQSAVRLTGFAGTVDEFCALPSQERADLLAKAPAYAIFIDEINRGNVARILGELITLLEPDKRLGAERELVVTLPYSRGRFGVPSNLYVIGTMNTADRSVEALDAALRRRFQFEELAPNPEVVDVLVEDQIDIAEMLTTMNRRLEKLLDRDHTIGHAFFEPLREDPSIEMLRKVFQGSVLPLLREYFFGDWGKIGLVLGKDFVSRQPDTGSGFADFEHPDGDVFLERATYEFTDPRLLTSVSFRRIYEQVADA